MLYTTAAFSLLAAAVVAQDAGATVATPNGLSTCQPTLLSWTGGSPPYYVSVIEGGNPNGKAYKSFPQTDSTSLTWKVTEVPAGQSVTVQVKDGSGQVKYSAAVTVADGGSCSSDSSDSSASSGASGAAAASGSSASGSADASSGSGAAAAAGTTGSSDSAATSGSGSSGAASSGAASGSAKESASAASGSAKAAASSAKSGAYTNVASFGLVAAAGALAALF